MRAVQILLGHTKVESIGRYLGVDIDDALTLAESTELYGQWLLGCGREASPPLPPFLAVVFKS